MSDGLGYLLCVLGVLAGMYCAFWLWAYIGVI